MVVLTFFDAGTFDHHAFSRGYAMSIQQSFDKLRKELPDGKPS
jgi:hypothetical protein